MPPPPPTPMPVELKIMTINLRHDVDCWEERFPLIADEIVMFRPDIIGMQEVEIGQDQQMVLDQLIRERASDLIYEIHHELKTGLAAISGEGIATFSRFPIVAKAVQDLSYGRPATLDRLRVSDDLELDFYNTHLHHEGGDMVRKPQADLLMTFVAQNTSSNPAFLTGDMNAKDDSEAMAAIYGGGFADSFRDVFGEETSRAGNTVPIRLMKAPVTQNPVNRIDYVLSKASATWKITAKSSTVAFNRPGPSGLYPSDHLGVMTTFRIEP
jgi:beta-glucosidase